MAVPSVAFDKRCRIGASQLFDVHLRVALARPRTGRCPSSDSQDMTERHLARQPDPAMRQGARRRSSDVMLALEAQDAAVGVRAGAVRAHAVGRAVSYGDDLG
jgi:hypothetical protein